MKNSFVSKKFWRALGVGALIVVVIAFDLFGDLLNWTTELLRKALVAIGFGRIEEWLRNQSLWVGLIPVTFAAAVYLFLKEREVASLVGGHLWSVLFYIVVSRLFEFSVVNFLLQIYGKQLLRYRWISWSYEFGKSWVLWARALVRKQLLYRRIMFSKQLLLTRWRKKRRTMWKVARRFVRTNPP